MKKVICIFLTMVMVALVCAIAFAGEEIATGDKARELYDRAYKWAEENGLYEYVNNDAVDGILYGCGGLDVEEFEKHYGVEYSISNFIKKSMYDYDMTECYVTVVGELEGVNVYRAYAEAYEPIGSKWNEETNEYEKYYKCDILFIVYDF